MRAQENEIAAIRARAKGRHALADATAEAARKLAELDVRTPSGSVPLTLRTSG